MAEADSPLGERDGAAIALEPEHPDLESSAAPRNSSQLTSTAAQIGTKSAAETTTKAPAKRLARAAVGGAIVRLGIYLTPAEFCDAKAAYLADWTSGGEADTFARWIAAAIDTYSRRTPTQRANATPRGRAEERTGSTRSFAIPIQTVSRMRAAITEDQRAGRWPSDSAWCGEAIAAAVRQARVQSGGSLPTPTAETPQSARAVARSIDQFRNRRQ